MTTIIGNDATTDCATIGASRRHPLVPATALAFAAALFAFGSAIPATAHDYEAGALSIGHPWARPSIGDTPNSAAYMTLANRGQQADRLVEVRSDVAASIELHTHIRDGDIMRMRKVEGGIEIPSGATAELKPGGYHVMLLGLTRRLTEGSAFAMTLVFERQGEVKVDVKVQKSPAGDAEHGGSTSHKPHKSH
jgi:copper(I)-binding protein